MSASNATSRARKAPPAGPLGTKSAASSSKTAERFTLAGPTLRLDPRTHAYRRDIADIALAGQLFAPHYARPTLRVCGKEPCPVRVAACEEADPVTQLLPGEEFAVLDIAREWSWGYRTTDHRVGYVANARLIKPL